LPAGVYGRPMADGHGHEKHPSLSFFLMPVHINGVVVVAWNRSSSSSSSNSNSSTENRPVAMKRVHLLVYWIAS